MKQRTKDYIARRKARQVMQHPDDLRSFLIAEHDSSRNILVKKDIKKMIDALGPVPEKVAE
jgi:hypothetical protein